MNLRTLVPIAAGLLSLVQTESASAQIPMNVPPIVSYYDAPPAYGVYLPATVQVTNSYYGQQYGGFGGTYFPIPSTAVSYFHPSAAIVTPVQVRYGMFGRVHVRGPMFRSSFTY